MIRKFKIEDINKVLEIEEQAFPKTAYPKDVFLECAKNFPESFVVVEANEDIAGYMIFDVGGHIHSMAVKAPFRRKGLGKMLFMHALRGAKKKLWLEVRSKNRGAIEFYKKMGMKIAGESPDYYGDDDALIMELVEKEWRKARTGPLG